MAESINVFGEPLQTCCDRLLTGFYRDGCCNTGIADMGAHVVCAQMTGVFLEYSRSIGNDLVTPKPEFGFPGLKPGNRWCLCAVRWREAYEAGAAPPVYLTATHIRALDYIGIELLKPYALDLV